MAKDISEERHQELVDEVLEQIKKDALHGDYTVLDELLKFIPLRNLLQALPEEDWKKFPEIKV
jgi:hypothetical protein